MGSNSHTPPQTMRDTIMTRHQSDVLHLSVRISESLINLFVCLLFVFSLFFVLGGIINASSAVPPLTKV